MATYIYSGASLECKESMVAVRKIFPRHPDLIVIEGVKQSKHRLYKYKTKIRALVKIKVELDPKECVIDEFSKLDLEDELEGDTVEIYTKERVKLELCSNFSNVHGIQANKIRVFTYAKVLIPWRHVSERNLIA